MSPRPHASPRTASALPRIATALAAFVLAGCTALGDHRAASRVDVSAVPQRDAAVEPLPDGWHHGAFIEIFVRGYQDSDGDGIGDLRGLTQRLDYLRDLGVRGIWLMPITRNADGDHGYATTDYRSVDPAYGTLEDFDTLVREARRRGIGVIMDYMVNHSAADHPLFVAARSSRSSRFRDWFVWSQSLPSGWDIWGKNPWYHVASEPWTFKGEAKDLPAPPAGARDFYFGTFGPHMPDFNLRRPEVVDYHLDSLRFWLNRGLAGFRLDAVPHMIENDAVRWNDQPESRALGRRMQDVVKSYPSRYVVCEATAEPQAWGAPEVCGGAFAFGLERHFAQAATGSAASVREIARYYTNASPTMATFASNHDIFAGPRLWDQVAGDSARYKLAAAGYLLLPGTPFIYYGEEVGQAGIPGLRGDFPLRGPMSWTADGGFTTGQPFRPPAPNRATHNAAAQAADPGSMLNFYKAMIALRNSRPSIARGSYEHPMAEGLLLGFQRALGSERTVVLVNYGTEPALAALPGLAAGARLRTLYPQAAAEPPAAGADGRAMVEVAPQSVRVLAVEPAR